MTLASIGVGITTYNRKWKLEETLARLRAVTPEPFDLLVADDGSTDGTVEYLAATGLDFVTGRNRGVAWNKNRALYTLFRRGHDAIVLLEDDAFPAERGWLSVWAEAARRHDHVNYAGAWFPAEVFVRGAGTLDDPFITTASTAQVSAFSRRAVERVGFFDTRFRGYGHEHVDLTQRMIRDGMGGTWQPAPDGHDRYEYVSLGSGMQPTADSSFFDDGQVTANAALFGLLRDEPLRREPWQDEAERAILLAEVGAVAAAPARDVWRECAFFRPPPAVKRRPVLALGFGQGGEGLGCLGIGWSVAEAEGIWAVDGESEIRLRLPEWACAGEDAAPGFELALSLAAFDRDQGVTVLLNGFDLGRQPVLPGGDTLVMFPAAVVAVDGVLRLRLLHPDGVRPADIGRGEDGRVLSVWLSRLSIRTLPFAPALWGESVEHMASKQLMQHFRSLGDNAEFSVVQQRLGLDLPSLFRQGGVTLPQIARGLACGFEGIDDPATLELVALPLYGEPRDYVGVQPAYGVHCLAEVKEGAMAPAAVHAIVAARLAVLRRLMLDDLRDGTRILVLRRERPLAEAEVIPVWTALRGQGGATLLYVTLADEAHPAGSVERRRAGLLCGRLDRLARADQLGEPSMEAWLAVCRAAYALWRAEEGRQEARLGSAQTRQGRAAPGPGAT